MAAQKPERDRVAVSGRDGEIYVAAGGIHPVFPDMQRVYHRESSAARVADIRGIGDFAEMRDTLVSEIEDEKRDCKEKLEAASKKDRKSIQAVSDQYVSMLQSDLQVLDEAIWLTEKFGNGEYRDIPGLCRVASREEIAEKNYSLTPGTYVGVAAVEDDGVDFAERMTEIHQELLKLQAESNELMQTISKNLEEMGL